MTIFGADTTFINLKHQYLSRSSYCIDMTDCQRKIKQEFAFFKTSIKDTTETCRGRDTHINDITNAAKNLDICMIGAAPFNTFVRQAGKARDIEIFSISMRDIKIALQPKKLTG